MHTGPSISSYILGGTLVILLASSVFHSSLVFVFADQFPHHRSQATAERTLSKASATTNIDRSRKGDRSPVMQVNNATIIRKNVGMSEHSVQGADPVRPETIEIDDGKRVPKVAPEPLLECEALASPISDPVLGRVIGRCFV